jgi:tetratricopeptide (TPR) repeat protein
MASVTAIGDADEKPIIEVISDNTDESLESVKERYDYYNKWEKKAKVLVEETDLSEEKEKEEDLKKVGLKDAPKSEAEAKDKAKFKALKEAKKQWDGKRLQEEELKCLLQNKNDANIDLSQKITNGKPVIVIKDCKKSKFVFPPTLLGSKSPLIKIFVDSCCDCKIFIACPLLVGIDVSHCENCFVTLLGTGPAAIKTIQIDLCDGIEIVYKENAMDNESKIYHAGLKNFKVVKNSNTESDTISHDSYLKLVKTDMLKDGTPAEEVQFVTHLVDQKLTTEQVLRVGNQPITQRELDDKKIKINMEPLNKLKAAKLDKLGGNEAFKEGNYSQAMVFYTKAIDVVNMMPVAEKPDLLHICYSNRAACWLKLGQPEKALDDAKCCVALSPKYMKGLFRAGLAHHALGQYQQAGPYFIKALDIQPKNKQVKDALKFAELKLRQEMLKRRKGEMKFS